MIWTEEGTGSPGHTLRKGFRGLSKEPYPPHLGFWEPSMAWLTLF